MQMLRNFMPLILIFLVSILLNGAAGGGGGTSASNYNYAFVQSYYYREKMTTHRIG